MARQFKSFFFVISVFVFCLFFNSPALAIDTFSVTLTPPALELVMQDSNAIIPVTVTNAVTSLGSVQSVTITVNPLAYTLSTGTTAPSGWCISKISTAKGSVSYSVIDTATGKCKAPKTATVPPLGIAPGASLAFNIMATPLSTIADIATDTVTVAVKTPKTFTQTGVLPSPTFTRRSLDAILNATPPSTNVGGEVTVNMQVSNKSTSPQTLIATTPAPPSATPAIASLSAGPFYASTSLSSAITATSTAITVGSTSGFAVSPSSIQIDSEKIWYTGMTATSFTGITRGYGGTTPASHSTGAVIYRLSPFSLNAAGSLLGGDTGTITWKYMANSAGTVNFNARASDSTGTANSLSKTSNSVTIGDFTSVIGIYPETAVNNQNVTVSMTVQNNGPSALVNVAPSALTAGAGCLATHTLVSGPSPASISSIAPGGSGVFTWTYTVAGTAGTSYCLSGYAMANGPVSSVASTSNTGIFSNFSTSITPASISSGTGTALAPQTFTWTITNAGTCPISRVEITIPTQATCATTGWCLNIAPATGYPATAPVGWTGTLRAGPPDTIRFTGAVNLLPGASATLPVPFKSTQTVTTDTYVNFPITLREAKTVAPCTAGLTDYAGSTEITVTANGMTIASAPVGPVPADGSSAYTITATLKNGLTPLSGKTISFSSTNGSLSSATAVTDANGVATVKLIAPSSLAALTATVTASYLNTAITTAPLSFSAYANVNLAYWGGLTPSCAVTGSPASFSLNVKNTSATAMALASNSFFAFNDGVNTYCAYLNSGSAGAVAGGSVKALTFGSSSSAGAGAGVTVPAPFAAGKYTPMSNATPCTGLASGLYLYESATSLNNQYRNITDAVTVGTSCAGAGNVGNTLNVIDWHEIK